jgi:hypothetical protein
MLPMTGEQQKSVICLSQKKLEKYAKKLFYQTLQQESKPLYKQLEVVKVLQVGCQLFEYFFEYFLGKLFII